MSVISVILAAAGQSSRFGHPTEKKTFVSLNSKPVWLHSADLFLKRPEVKQLIVVVAPEDKEEFYARFGPNVAVLGLDVVVGGRERCDSIANALEKVSESSQWVMVHDAARPCLDADMVQAVIDAAQTHQAAIPAIPVNSTLKRSADGQVIDKTEDRSQLYLAQTPQVFSKELLERAFAQRGDFQPTDEAQLVERMGHSVAMVPGSPLNVKITRHQDLAFAKACLAALPKPKFDAPTHPFADDNLFR